MTKNKKSVVDFGKKLMKDLKKVNFNSFGDHA